MAAPGLLSDELRAVAAAYPTRVALRVVDGDALTFAEWDRASNAAARALVASGVGPGDRVVLLLTNEAAVDYQVAYFGVLKAGAVAVPVNPRYARREIEHILANSGAGVVVSAGEQLPRATSLVSQSVAVVSADELGAGDRAPIQVDRRPDDLADILYTSGTTGLPKGVAATHRSALTQLASPVDREAVLLHAIPLTTFVGTHGAMVMGLRMGLSGLVLPSFSASRFAELVEQARPRWMLIVPAHALLLLESGALRGRDTSAVRVILYGSAPMPPQAVEELAGAFPRAALIGGYGLTEAGSSVVSMPPGEAVRRLGSVGRPIDPAGLRVVDDGGDARPAGEVGEVVIAVAPGQRFYFNDPEATASTWRDGWVHSGDLGYLDADGFLYLVDRKKDMIVRGGYNVYSIEVEGALYEHPDILEAAVVGIPHDVLGQDVAAVVRLRPGAELSLDAVRLFLADRLADYKLPRRLEAWTDPLPRSGMGKVDKRALLAAITQPVAEAGGTTGTGRS